MPTDKFEGGKDSFGNKAVTSKFKDYSDKVTFPSKDPIPEKQINIDRELYTDYHMNLVEFNILLRSLILSSLNGQRVEYVILDGKLRVKRKGMTSQNKDQCLKYIKERLSFTNTMKIKEYQDASPEVQKKLK